MKYIDAEKLIAEIDKRLSIFEHGIAYSCWESCKKIVESLQQEQPEDIVVIAKTFLDALSKTPYNNMPITDAQIIVKQLLLFFENPKEYNPNVILEQPEVDYNIVPLSEERMASYIDYCLGREDDDCNCPTCGKHVTGLRLFPYYYDRENNDVYFASVCPECGKIIISKE